MAKRLMGVLTLLPAIFLTLFGSTLSDTKSVPAVYLFGDSTFDVGTNNFLNDSTARADKESYGIDFPNKKPTGRFSNGYNTADRIVKLLGLHESPPPYLYLEKNDTENFNKDILKGVNFASGGSGILHETGKRPYTDVVSMADQIEQFRSVFGNMSQCLNGSAEATINKSIFLISVGSNDIFEFFFYNLSNNPNISLINVTLEEQKFFNTLMTNYQTHLKNLLELGARKFGILSVPPIGCVPILTGGNGECGDVLNNLAQVFHPALSGVLKNLSSEFPDMKYSLGDSYNITYDIINDPSSYHLSDVASACCGNATFISGVSCGPNATVCENRYEFLFWDQYHPTDHVSRIVAHTLYTGGTQGVAPINFSQLVYS